MQLRFLEGVGESSVGRSELSAFLDFLVCPASSATFFSTTKCVPQLEHCSASMKERALQTGQRLMFPTIDAPHSGHSVAFDDTSWPHPGHLIRLILFLLLFIFCAKVRFFVYCSKKNGKKFAGVAF